MCRKRLSSPRCRSELIDSAWVVIVPGQKCIKNKNKNKKPGIRYDLKRNDKMYTPQVLTTLKLIQNIVNLLFAEILNKRLFKYCAGKCILHENWVMGDLEYHDLGEIALRMWKTAIIVDRNILISHNKWFMGAHDLFLL